jgi:hypothetical protein
VKSGFVLRYETNLFGVRIRDYDTKRIHGFAKQIHVFTNLLYDSRILKNNPLCSVSEEISEVKKILDLSESGQDKLKLNQKTSSVSLKIFKNDYFFKTDLKVSDDYPAKQVGYKFL